MCYRSKHGAITAWCATTFINITTRTTTTASNQTLQEEKQQQVIFKPNSRSHPTDLPPIKTNSRGYSSSVYLSLYRCLLLFLLFFAQIPGLVTAKPLTSNNMTPDSSGNGVSNSSPTFLKQQKQQQNRSCGARKQEIWNEDFINYVCNYLTDPCSRATYLRLNATHDICYSIPALYLLPHASLNNESLIPQLQRQNDKHVQLCDPGSSGSRTRRSDGLYRKYLETPEQCRRSLESLNATIHAKLKQDLDSFQDILNRSFYNISIDNSSKWVDYQECKVSESSILNFLLIFTIFDNVLTKSKLHMNFQWYFYTIFTLLTVYNAALYYFDFESDICIVIS